MLNDRTDVEGHGPHVEEHAGDVQKGREEEDALTTEEGGKEGSGEALGEGPRRLAGGEPGSLGAAAVAETRRRPERRLRRRRAVVAAARQPVVRHPALPNHMSNVKGLSRSLALSLCVVAI